MFFSVFLCFQKVVSCVFTIKARVARGTPEVHFCFLPTCWLPVSSLFINIQKMLKTQQKSDLSQDPFKKAWNRPQSDSFSEGWFFVKIEFNSKKQRATTLLWTCNFNSGFGGCFCYSMSMRIRETCVFSSTRSDFGPGEKTAPRKKVFALWGPFGPFWGLFCDLCVTSQKTGCPLKAENREWAWMVPFFTFSVFFQKRMFL